MDEKVLEVCFQIITYVGTAKSMYINAIQLAKQGEFEQAKDRIKQGEEAFVQGHNAHHSLFEEFIAVYKRFEEGK